LFLVAGIAVGAWLAWLLWGTGLSTARAQRALRTEFERTLGRPDGPGGTQAPPVLHFRDGAPFAVIRIPAIHLDMVVVEGTSGSDLQKGPGHYVATAYPWDPHGRVAIAGHRTTYLHPFWSIDRLRTGDVIQLQTRFGVFDYRVTATRTVLPTAAW